MNRSNTEEAQSTSAHERKHHRDRHPESGYVDERRRAQVARLREVSVNLGQQIGDQVRKRPYAAIGAAAAVGFVAGSIFGSRPGQLVLACGLGYLARNALNGPAGVERIQAGLEKLAGEAVPASS
ncbi:MAG: hypothetical protein ABSC94_15065 [Polyangiaceae bacterium]|jgi:ElaB/YqjD/DUF883 family membrane-anchored ribosome-binding protein